MPLFPKITSPCPYVGRLAGVMDGDFCRMCQRQVFDLSGWSDDERRSFLAGCEEEVCVSYRLPVRSAIAAAALAASTVALPAAAQDQPVAVGEPQLESDPRPSEMVIIVGGIRNPSRAEFVEAKGKEPAPELPVVYEDEAPAPRTRVSPAG